MKNKWKNYGLWAAIAALIPILVQSLGVYDINILLPDNYEQLVATILNILVLAGIISNPSIGKGFKDKED